MRGEGRGVIFDMDGVLADTASAHYKSWQVVAERWNVQITREAFKETFGRPNHQIIPTLMGREVTAEEMAEIDRLKEQAFRDMLGEEIDPVPGAVELIEELHERGFRLAVGSSGPPENIQLMLRSLGLMERFEHVVSGKDVERGKPDPDVFLQAARGIGVAPSRCLVIEDVPAGIRAAHAAGMPCIALATTRPASELEEAEQVHETLRSVDAAMVLELLGSG